MLTIGYSILVPSVSSIQKRIKTSKCFDEKCIDEIQHTKQKFKLSKDRNKKLQKEMLSLQEEVEKINIRVKDITSENSTTNIGP